MWQGSLGYEKLREDVGAKRAFKLLGSDFLDRVLGVLLGGVIDEDIEASRLLDRLPNGFLAE